MKRRYIYEEVYPDEPPCHAARSEASYHRKYQRSRSPSSPAQGPNRKRGRCGDEERSDDEGRDEGECSSKTWYRTRADLTGLDYWYQVDQYEPASREASQDEERYGMGYQPARYEDQENRYGSVDQADEDEYEKAKVASLDDPDLPHQQSL